MPPKHPVVPTVGRPGAVFTDSEETFMDSVMDQWWSQIVSLFTFAAGVLDRAFAPLKPLGPTVTIFVIVLLTVCVTKLLSRYYMPKRYLQLQKDFQYWFKLRQQALSCDDPEKAKWLAKNIDEAQLNRVYYDYFFEGLLRNILTQYIPMLLMLGYVNESYRPERLLQLYGRDCLFHFSWFVDKPVAIGAVFWFVFSWFAILSAWTVIKHLPERFNPQRLIKTRKAPV